MIKNLEKRCGSKFLENNFEDILGMSIFEQKKNKLKAQETMMKVLKS